MHVRWSALRGMPVTEEQAQESVAILTDPLIDADSGRILGFFVRMQTGFSSLPHFLSALDILSVGTRVHIRSMDVLAPPDELIRLQQHLADPRSFLGQKIRIRQSGRTVGTCRDIQFDTRHFVVEWLFPRGFLFTKQPIAASDIVEVTEEAIWVNDPFREEKENIQEERTGAAARVLPDMSPGTIA